MRLSMLVTAAALLFVVGSVRAEETPRALIEKAVKAQGGSDLVAQATAIHTRYKVKITDPDPSPEVVCEGEAFDQPGRHKWIERDGIGRSFATVIDGERAWFFLNGKGEEVLGEMKDAVDFQYWAYQKGRVPPLLPLLKDKDCTLTALGESRVKTRAALGVKTSRKGKPDVSLFFDKETGLLLKHSWEAEIHSTDDARLHEVVYSDYREIDPVADAEKALKGEKLGTDGPALLKHLRAWAPDPRRIEKVKELIKQLGDDAFAAREKAVADLIAVGEPALPLLREAVKATDLEVARRAKDCLQRIGPQARSATAAAAVRLVAVKRPAGAVEALLDYLPAADEPAAREVKAALALLAQKDGKPDPALLKALEDKDPLRRKAAEAALGKDGGDFLKQPGRMLLLRGLKLPRKMTYYQDGKKVEELEIIAVEHYNRFEDKVFARP